MMLQKAHPLPIPDLIADLAVPVLLSLCPAAHKMSRFSMP